MKDNTHSIALTCSFMAVGMNNAAWAHGDCDSVYQAWGNGGIELHAELIDYAVFNDKLFDTVDRITGEGGAPGVWEYDVSEPFGKWFGEKILAGDTPSQFEGQREMIEKACMFWFSNKPVPEILNLISAVAREMQAPKPEAAQVELSKLEALRDELAETVRRVRGLEDELCNVRSATNLDRNCLVQENNAFIKLSDDIYREVVARNEAAKRVFNTDQRIDGMAMIVDKLEERVRCTEERYSGFLVGLSDNVEKQVKDAVSARMEKVTDYIDKRVDRQVREAFQKARDAL